MVRDERGTVTAETVMVIPVLTALAIGLFWLVSLGVTHVRAVDAARETARMAARGDSVGQARSIGLRVAPEGSRITVRRSGTTVVVTVAAPVRGPGGLLAAVAGFDVHAEAVAVREPTS